MKDWRVVAAIFIGGTALTLARRWHNTDPEAGGGVAFVTVLLVLLYL
jgi:hypothetical protein